MGVPVLLLVTLLVASGPRPRFQERWVEPNLSDDLDAYLEQAESSIPGIRAGDQRSIVWHDPQTMAPTGVSIVYLHGFSADRHEIEPVVSQLADSMEANVYFARLKGHGRDGAAMAEASVEDWLEDAVEALAIGERIGQRVLLMGTSTGGTLATWLASRPESTDRIHAMVLISPNFQPADRASRIFLFPWGGVVARAVAGGERCFSPISEAQRRHWTTCYPTSALSPMMALVERVRTGDLSTVATPTLVLLSGRDQVVDGDETRRVMERMTGTDVTVHLIPDTGDPAGHVLAGDIVSPVSNEGVLRVILDFVAAGGLGR